ncbi:MAG: DNA helicase RecQ [Spirochaetaceae bacterium]
MASTPDDALKQVLQHYFGFTTFKPNQRHIIESWLSGRDVFAALPTGGGKSLCYQLPALIRDGLSVVVSPLIALMKDQVDAARENGIPAAFLNSSQDAEAARQVWRDLAARRLKLLYVSPERLAGNDFRKALADFGVSAFAVDEAHCVSEWGHEFRPEYRSLSSLREIFPEAPVAAFTATATRSVQDDIVAQLGLRDPVAVRASFNRPEITYRVRRKTSVETQVLSFVRDHAEEPGIIYRSTRTSTEKTAESLRQHGMDARAYHAGLKDAERAEVQERFVRDDLQIVVATIAFGMGIDKSNVRWILHADLPKSLEGYYQETGRAGRDGEAAEALLLWGGQDIAMIRRHIENAQIPQERVAAEGRLREVLSYADGSACRRTVLLSHFDEDYPGQCGACDICLDEIAFDDATVPAQKLMSAAVRTGEVFGTHHLVDIVTGTATDKVLERGHNNLPTFGVGEDLDRGYWISLARDLESGGYMLRRPTDTGLPGGLMLSSKGRQLLRGRERFAAQKRSAEPGNSSVAPRDTGNVDKAPLRRDQQDLFRCLKQLRKKLARERGVPPYAVFSDKTLKVMVKNRPTDAPAFLRCHGVGDRKLEAYGEDFLRTIRNFLATGDCE